ncbi:DDB1- and CUL4-associated factor 17-like [Dendronephthya gigantea]|uniref:DDB1- and CUL4-associated factor 17-like n=1 Tax=Dendronephthya gigantea TaxID=151771 RepID=UPI0010692A98|nr:DDB1- and CUL4-associated factor 17-like [Dendronephthya gigantea]
MAYFTRKKRYSSVFKAVIYRQIYGTNVQQDVRMVRTMIESSRKFEKVSEIGSKAPIVYIGERLYTNYYRTSIDLTHVKRRPRIVYNVPKHPSHSATKFKTEEMLVYECPVDQETFCKLQGTFYVHGPYSVGVTADNYLKVFDFNTGESLKQIYLYPGRKFKYLHWETDLERLVVQSTLLPQEGSAHVTQRTPPQSNPVLLYIAIFTMTPLEFICMLPISQKIFGKGICNAVVRDGMLVVMYQRQKLQFFSLEDILKNHTMPLKVGDQIQPGNNLCLPEIDDQFAGGIVGMLPLGLPVNVSLFEKPPVLLEVKSSDHELSFGGFPWHYVSNINYVFQVHSVKDHTLAENGILNIDDAIYFGTEKAFFHPDMSGRILFIAPPYLRCIKLRRLNSYDRNSAVKVEEQFTLDYLPETKTSTVVQTKSGRKIKNLFKGDLKYLEMEIVQDFDYDDELDLLVVLYLNLAKQGEGVVGFYDNQTGRHIQEVGVEDIEEDYEHTVAINRDVLIVLSRKKQNFRCLVYILNTT